MSAASGSSTTDTIAAIATPAGRGALAIVRLSGPSAHAIGRTLLRPWPDVARRATLTRVHDPEDRHLDDAIAIRYDEPASFTGEPLVEIVCHGGHLVAATIAAAMVTAGARPAEPGEFTRRAVLNGKLDLLQAEAVGDLVDAGSRAAQRVALTQLDGGLSRRIHQLRDQILALEALAAYDIDFPEEDDGPVAASTVVDATDRLLADIAALLETAPAGEVVRHGAVVVIAGAPNVGKSSLFNALLGRQRAIVTDIPGTTRDALEAVTEAAGWPVRLVDTAGLRDTGDVIERLGIEVSRTYLDQADVVLACGDSAESMASTRTAMQQLTKAPVLSVRTKMDVATTAPAGNEIGVSAETGLGLGDLARAIGQVLESAKGALTLDAPLVTRERHRVALAGAHGELVAFRQLFAERTAPVVVAAVHLREATRQLEELVGTVDVEDVLTKLFSSFCVGK